MAGERLGQPHVLHSEELKKRSWESERILCGYQAVGQQVLKEAGIARALFFDELVAHKVGGPVPIAADAVLARDRIGVPMVPQSIELHGQQAHGQNNEEKPTTAFATVHAPELHLS